MFCARCRTEYREGFRVCSDCGSDLVDELPPKEEPEFIDYIELLETFNTADIAVIKSILDGENITYYFSPENFMYIGPLAVPAKLMVVKSDVKKAKAVLKGLNLSIFGIDVQPGEADD